ncbi:peptidyl-prolyl cis-trans isomerase [Mangrovicoccus algicola]|uniref:Parvulin-like PPIase n=1 Tax=Mangrovicoccus algicola TaxID=2771008 RepID=A0A8J7CZ41_9RHOB|nr:peptidyl-prolyl cis-trans isomerase [Mangrovicoccus algicola]MBE3640377.1 peptidyl-prolyl cis-trans isomerase [Mangrovicoccus algicola]
MAKRDTTDKPKGKSKLSNILVLVLLGVLLLGLGGYGVTGFNTQVRSVGNVGETPIDAATYHGLLRQRMDQVTQQTGEAMTFAEAEQMGLAQAVLQQVVSTAALQETARRADLSVGDAEVARRIAQVPAFQGMNGEFDRDAYRDILDRSGRTVAGFEESVRREAAADLLQRALLNGLTPPAIYGETLLGYVGEARSVSWAAIPETLLEAQPEAPTEEEVQAWYEANADQFTLPERKQITYAWLSAEMMLDQVELSDADLRAGYEARSAEFSRPERRMVDRLGFADLDAAQAALEAIEAGETSFDALIADRGLAEGDVDLGTITRGVLTPEAGEAVFALEDTGIAGPVMSAVGPALFRVNAIMTAQETSFEEALPQLREEMALARAAELIRGEIDPLDDELAGGATLEDLAADTPMQTGTVTWDGETVPSDDPAAQPEFMNAAAAATEGDFPEITTTESGLVFALRVDAVLPSELRPLEEVRAEAEEGAAAQKRADALAALGDTLKSRLDAGEDFAALGLEPQSRDGLTRQAPAFDLPGPVLQTLYDLEAGETAVATGPEGAWLLRVDGVTPPDMTTADARAALEQVRQETTMAVADDILNQLAREETQKDGLDLNQTALTAIHNALR